MTHETPPKHIEIWLIEDTFLNFHGWYRRDLEQKNWHYYEATDGKLYHCRKEHMILVIEKEIKEDEKEAA